MVERKIVIICDFGEDLGECPHCGVEEDILLHNRGITPSEVNRLKREIYCMPCLEAMKVRKLRHIESAIIRLG